MTPLRVMSKKGRGSRGDLDMVIDREDNDYKLCALSYLKG